MEESPIYDLIIVGSGAAGLTAALHTGKSKVLIVTKTKEFYSGSSPLAQGGIAASVGSDDSAELHTVDTIKAGAYSGISDQITFLTENGVLAIDRLLKINMPFDKTDVGSLDRNREAAHSRRRVLKAGGDATGKILVKTLYAEALKRKNLEWQASTFINNLIIRNNTIQGVSAYSSDKGWHTIRSKRVLLATGGLGQLFGHTTNPKESTGDSLAIAVRAGLNLKEIEMVQFHPTALNIKTGSSLKLLTEALRGDGAKLVKEGGIPFMGKYSPLKELAPRDIVARAIWNEMQQGHKIFLDLKPIKNIGQKFPTVSSFCLKAGLNPNRDLIPITPAVHYVMGGVNINSKLPLGLGAAGEASYTGVHGANRLASNSLLECLVYGKSEVERILKQDHKLEKLSESIIDTNVLPMENILDLKKQIQDNMYVNCGIIRNQEELQKGECNLLKLEQLIKEAPKLDLANVGFEHMTAFLELNNMITTGLSLIRSATYRKESRGAHYREDFPKTSIKWDRIKIIGDNSEA